MEVKFKKMHEDAVIPYYATEDSNGLDLTVVSNYSPLGGIIEYDTGIAVEIPTGYVGLVFPRSSISKMSLIMANSVGVIDSDFRGSIKIRTKFLGLGNQYENGDKIAQLVIMPCPRITVIESDTLSDTNRGSGGFGSTGS